jgi:hypothetical protein
MKKYLYSPTLINDYRFGFVNVYDDPNAQGGGGDGGGDGGEGATATANATGANNGTNASNNGTGNNNSNADDSNNSNPLTKLKFTAEQQDFLNKKLQEEKKKWQSNNEKTIEELRKLQQASTTSEKQKQELEKRINELQQQFLSREELQKQEQEKKQKEFQQQLSTAQNEAKHWRELFHTSTIKRALQDGAVESEAYNPAQIEAILFTSTQLVEEMDEENKGTGRLVPRVKLEEQDPDGKTKVLNLTVRETLQKMKNTPERYGNLFKAGLNGGVGLNGSQTTGKKKVDFANMSPEQWAEYRKKNPNFTDVGKK